MAEGERPEAEDRTEAPTQRRLDRARALFRLEPDTELPAEYWQAVAEIIAFVWGLRPHA